MTPEIESIRKISQALNDSMPNVSERLAKIADSLDRQERERAVVVKELADALESTVWSSKCWCSGRDKRGHSATCEGRKVALRGAGRDW